MRIVSLLPSATEMICTLGLEDQLVGVTHECDSPPFVAGLPKVTRTLIPADASSAEIDRLVRDRLRTNRALYTLDLPTLEGLRPRRPPGHQPGTANPFAGVRRDPPGGEGRRR